MIIFPLLYIILFFLVLIPLFFHWLSSLCSKRAIKCLSLLLPKNLKWSFPGGSVIKNPPADAGDTCSVPGPGSPHVPWSSEAPVTWLLSQCSRAQEPLSTEPPQYWAPEPGLHNKGSCKEKPDHWNERVTPLLLATRENPKQQWRPGTAKINKIIKKIK